MNAIISVDIKSNNNGTYDTYIVTETSSGEHYPKATASEIGEYVADLIDTLEEDTGNSYLTNTVSIDKKILERELQEISAVAYNLANDNHDISNVTILQNAVSEIAKLTLGKDFS